MQTQQEVQERRHVSDAPECLHLRAITHTSLSFSSSPKTLSFLAHTVNDFSSSGGPRRRLPRARFRKEAHQRDARYAVVHPKFGPGKRDTDYHSAFTVWEAAGPRRLRAHRCFRGKHLQFRQSDVISS